MAEYLIVVRELASKDIVHSESFEGDQHEVGRRAGSVWMPPYSTNPDRYRLYVFEKGQKRCLMTIG